MIEDSNEPQGQQGICYTKLKQFPSLKFMQGRVKWKIHQHLPNVCPTKYGAQHCRILGVERCRNCFVFTSIPFWDINNPRKKSTIIIYQNLKLCFIIQIAVKDEKNK